MGDEIDLIENKVSDDEQSESSYPIFNPVENFDPTFTLRMMFSTKGELRKAIQSHAIKTRRHVICTKSDPNRYYAKCGDTDCDWRLHAHKLKDECTFQIRDYNPKHKCAKTFNLKNVKSSWLCDKYLDKFKSDPKRSVKGFRVDAINEIRCHISKHEAYKAKKKALKKLEGSPEYQYTRLWDYTDEIRRTNPGSTVIVGTEDVDGENRFSRFYVCFLAMKNGFKEGCRKIIGVDGCHLKGPHGGILLTAVGLVPNNNLYPIAYAVVNAESRETWEWFLILLKTDLGFRGLAFKHASWRAAKACTKGEFKARMMDIQVLEQTAFDWFSDKPPKQWSRSHFSPNVKCDMLLNNYCETFNMMILDAREKPILTMLEWIREFLMKRLQENRDMAEVKWKGRICPKIRKILDKHIEKVGDCIPIKADNFHYQISCFDGGQYALDLSNHTCSCRKWELSGIPCKHAISAIFNEKDDPEDYIDGCYSVIAYKRIYASAIMPMGGENQWNETCFIPPLPPKFGRRSGRPSTTRRRDPDEPMTKKKKEKRGNGMRVKRQQLTVKCSKCGQEKHNERTCPNKDQSQCYEEITDLTVEEAAFDVFGADEALPTKLNVADKGKKKVTNEAPIISAPITGKDKGKKKVNSEAEIILAPITGKDKGKRKVTNEAEIMQVDNEAEIILPLITSLVTSQSAENEMFTTLQVPNPVSNSPQYTKGPSMYSQLHSVGHPRSATSRIDIRAPPPMLGINTV
ncbi:uncharacterized protein LOC105155556 [Sesamum indicum]|uniref:Uncharacterized protein LOC105155556 n=1 Tax=Sesamum indicum TaxID=4182 RepID=A0A6I9SK88_SESIN|nr:uncharacterized protein LOC105155556 [Sesamum indicum]